MNFKIVSLPSRQCSIHEDFFDDHDFILPSANLEDSDETELFLGDVLMDDKNQGWILQLHEKGYLCLIRIGATIEEEPTAVMDVDGFKFGKWFYRLPMKLVGNIHLDKIHQSVGSPKSCELKFRKYLAKKGFLD